jgi:uncharacterized protein involved in tellurium resistance
MGTTARLGSCGGMVIANDSGREVGGVTGNTVGSGGENKSVAIMNDDKDGKCRR